MGHPELMSTKSTSTLLLMSSAHFVMVSGKQPSTWRHNGNFRTEAIFTSPQADVDKVIQQLWAAQTSLKKNLRWRHLDAKHVFTLVSFQERPLGLLALQQVCAHGHLPTGDVGSEALAHATERQISTLRKEKEYYLESKKCTLFIHPILSC